MCFRLRPAVGQVMQVHVNSMTRRKSEPAIASQQKSIIRKCPAFFIQSHDSCYHWHRADKWLSLPWQQLTPPSLCLEGGENIIHKTEFILNQEFHSECFCFMLTSTFWLSRMLQTSAGMINLLTGGKCIQHCGPPRHLKHHCVHCISSLSDSFFFVYCLCTMSRKCICW